MPRKAEMLKKLLIATAMLFAMTAAEAVPVTPATIPHITFVGAAGLPCAGCSLHTYIAGTTTDQATYTDSSGTTQNQNPIILDAAGGANIWLGRNSYKFILKSALGTTIWSVDNVNAANLFPCSPANSIQIANSGVNGLNCDPNITIDTINHTLSVGTLGANYVTIGALGTATSWFFDTTTPATACASIGCNFTFPGAGIPKSTGTAWGTSYTTSGTGTVVALATSPVFVTPTLGAASATSLAIASGTALSDNQGNGAKVQHSTGTTTSGNGAAFDANGNIIDSGFPVSGGSQSLTTDGYTTLPGGLIIQWGVITIAACGTSHCDSPSTSIPLTFPTAAFSCTATAQSDIPTGGWNMIATMVNAFDTGHITVSIDTSQTAVHFSNNIPVGWQCYGH